MPNFIVALVLVFGGLWLIRKFGKLKPAASRGLIQKLAGGGIIAASGLLALRSSCARRRWAMPAAGVPPQSAMTLRNSSGDFAPRHLTMPP